MKKMSFTPQYSEHGSEMWSIFFFNPTTMKQTNKQTKNTASKPLCYGTQLRYSSQDFEGATHTHPSEQRASTIYTWLYKFVLGGLCTI